MKFAKERNTKSSKSSNNEHEPKEKKIVKLNKKKIFLISFLVVALIIGVTVGIYYAVVPNGKAWPSDLDKVSTNTAQNQVNDTYQDPSSDESAKYDYDGDGEGEMFVYIGAEDCDYCQFSMYGSPDEEGNYDEDNLSGVFGEYAQLTDEESRLHGVAIYDYNVGETQLAFAELFLEGDIYDKENEPELLFNESGVWYFIENASLSKEDAFATQGSSAINPSTDQYYLQAAVPLVKWYEETDTAPAHYGIEINNSGSEWGTTPTWLYFKNGELKFYVQGIINTEETTGEDGSTTSTEGIPTSDFWNIMEEILIDDTYPIPN